MGTFDRRLLQAGRSRVRPVRRFGAFFLSVCRCSAFRYLPKFKWSQLKEGAVYNNQVRKARLEQRVNQARRENNLFLERVEEAAGD